MAALARVWVPARASQALNPEFWQYVSSTAVNGVGNLYWARFRDPVKLTPAAAGVLSPTTNHEEREKERWITKYRSSEGAC